jgi:UDP-N-acetylmuramate dehydrogenase
VNEILENVALAPFTTLQIGGPARYFSEASTIEDVFGALDFARSRDLQVFVLGGGSNLLISDAGIDGLVIRVAIQGLTIDESQKKHTAVTAGAGISWDELVEKSVSMGLAGFECLSGIPGLVGGSPIQNIGAYGQEVSESIVAVCCVDRVTGKVAELTNADCNFSYRSSIFNGEFSGRYIVLGVTYSLVKGSAPKIVYKDLIEYFAQKSPTLREVRDAVLRIRRSKSMVIDHADQNSRSAGSFFKNPVIDGKALEALQASFGPIPSFHIGNRVKVPAAWLIENAGFHKGYGKGNVGISESHTLAIINRGNGTAAEVLELMNEIQRAVSEKYDIDLLPEPIFVGF